MLTVILIAVIMVCVTTIVQATFMVTGVRYVHWRLAHGGYIGRHSPKAVLVSAFTAWMFIGMVLEALLWALLYLYHPAVTSLQNLETAVYFSMATFTTVGYGDVVLVGEWRLLAALEAADGMILFGWTTALIIYVIGAVYEHH